MVLLDFSTFACHITSQMNELNKIIKAIKWQYLCDIPLNAVNLQLHWIISKPLFPFKWSSLFYSYTMQIASQEAESWYLYSNHRKIYVAQGKKTIEWKKKKKQKPLNIDSKSMRLNSIRKWAHKLYSMLDLSMNVYQNVNSLIIIMK